MYFHPFLVTAYKTSTIFKCFLNYCNLSFEFQCFWCESNDILIDCYFLYVWYVMVIMCVVYTFCNCFTSLLLKTCCHLINLKLYVLREVGYRKGVVNNKSIYRHLTYGAGTFIQHARYEMKRDITQEL